MRPLCITLSLALACAAVAGAADRVSLVRDGKTLDVSGKVLVEAQDGGLLLLAGDNQLWMIQPDEIKEKSATADEFEPLPADAAAEKLLKELPDGFSVHHTAHYVILYNTSRYYAQWCGALYERLYRGFFSYWDHKGVELQEPAWPLVALVFADADSYAEHARGELGEAARSIIGYYSMQTNRVVMYDLTGADGLRRPGRISSADHVNQILRQPAAERTVATIVHEATHQLAYNSGLQTRYADIPYWVSEGIAVYFESPDLSNAKGWRGIGAVNQFNLVRFRQSLAERPAGALEALLADNARFRDPKTAGTAYAEAWALTYFLFRTREEDYLAYLKELSELAPLANVPREDKIARFKAHFGDDLEKLDAELVRYFRR